VIAGGGIESIGGVGSGDGTIVFVGTDMGRIFTMSPPDWTAVEITPAGNAGRVSRFNIQSNTLVFAMVAGQALFRFDGAAWTTLPAPPGAQGDYWAIDSDWTKAPQTLFLATENRVYSSADNGNSWTDISAGLPEAPHCTDLRFVAEASGINYLYAATHGWSMYRLVLNVSDQFRQEVRVTGRMDLVDRVALGHDQWAHPQFSNLAVLSAAQPVADFTIPQDDGSEIHVDLEVHLQWHIDQSVDVSYTVSLLAKDENDKLEDKHTGSFNLPLGASRQVIEDLTSNEFWPDRAHIVFTVNNS